MIEKTYTTIRISKRVWQKLMAVGKKGETFDQIILRLLEAAEHEK